MIKSTQLKSLFFFILLLLSSTGFAQSFVPAGSIVYPFRASPAIAKTGTQFHILYNNKGQHKIDSVVLKGPYSRIRLKVDSISKGRFEYDTYTTMYTNNKIWVTVPKSSPIDMYDLVVYTEG